MISFGAPFVVSMAYIYIYPLFDKVLYKRWRGNQSSLKEIKTYFDEEEPLSREKSRELINKHFVMQREFSDNYESVLSEIESYKQEISSYLSEKEHLSKELEKIRESQNISNEEKRSIQKALETISAENENLKKMLSKPVLNNDALASKKISINSEGKVIYKNENDTNESSYLNSADYSFSSAGLKETYSIFESLIKDIISQTMGIPRESKIHVEFDLSGQPIKHRDIIDFLTTQKITETGNGKFNLTKDGIDFLDHIRSGSEIINDYFEFFMDYIKSRS